MSKNSMNSCAVHHHIEKGIESGMLFAAENEMSLQ